MTATRSAGIAALLALAACGMLRRSPRPETPAQGYMNSEAHFSFLIPRGWQEKRFALPLLKSSVLARFESSPGGALAVAASGPREGRSCIEAGRALVESLSSESLGSEEPFRLQTAAAELAAAQGETASDARQGRVKLFCEGDRVVVLEASADKQAYAERQPELAAILDSFTYEGTSGGTPVRVPRPSASATPTPEPSDGTKPSGAKRSRQHRPSKRAGAAKAPAARPPELPAVIGPR